MRLEEKVAIVTGGTGEIGAAIARRFVSEGAAAVICGRNRENGEAVAAGLCAAGGRAWFVRADLSSEDDARHVVDETVRRFGRIDILVNNAAPIDELKAGRDKPLGDQDSKDFDYIMKVGLYGPYWISKRAVKAMILNPGGVIINISSGVAVSAVPSRPGYCASKAGLEGLTRSIAYDYADHSIRCVGVRLGYVQSNDISRRVMEHPNAGPQMRQVHLTRLGVPEDVAGIVTFLASDEAAYVSGTIWAFDGGSSSKATIPDLTIPYRDVMAEIAGGRG